MTSADILRSAKAVIERDGWKQGYVRLATGRSCCMTVAIWRVATGHDGDDLRVKAMDFLAKAIDVKAIAGVGIIDWNDAPGRTVEEVYAAYDTAITAADLAITHAELSAMPMPQAVVAYLRACRTFKDPGDIDGPWHELAGALLHEAVGVCSFDAYYDWEKSHTKDEVFAVYDKAIAAAEKCVSA